LIRLQHLGFPIRRLRRLGEIGRIVADDIPNLCLPERPVQHCVDQSDRTRRQTLTGQRGVERRKVGRTKLLEPVLAQMPADVVQNVTITLTTMRANVIGDPISLKSIQEPPKTDLVWVNCTTALLL